MPAAVTVTTPAAGSSVEKRTARHGPAAATDICESTGGAVSTTAAVSKIPTTPAGSAAPEASSLPAPKAMGQAAPAGNMPVRGTR